MSKRGLPHPSPYIEGGTKISAGALIYYGNYLSVPDQEPRESAELANEKIEERLWKGVEKIYKWGGGGGSWPILFGLHTMKIQKTNGEK